MREIKFRAKHKTTGEWWYGLSSMYKQVLNICPMSIFWMYYDTNVLDKETLGQYTGLKDKNGKEIYEGNLIKHHDPKFLGVDEVIACWGGWGCRPRLDWYGKPTIEPYTRTYHAFQVSSEYITKGIVIGTIYENPELLGD